MAITEIDKSNIRRYLEYSVIGLYRQGSGGGTLASMNTGFRMLNSYGNLEFKLNNLLPNEEARLTGRIYGSVGFVQPNSAQYNVEIDPGSTIQISLASSAFTASPVVINYTVQPQDTFLSICGQIAQLAANDGVFTSAGFYAMNDYGAGPYSQPNAPAQQVSMPIVSFVSPTPYTPFTLTVSGTGQTIPQIINPGTPLSPTLTSNQGCPPIKIYGYLPILEYLEDQMAGQTSDNLSVYKAGEVTLRPTEMRDRQRLFTNYCKRLATFLGIRLNPENSALTGRDTFGSVSGSWIV